MTKPILIALAALLVSFIARADEIKGAQLSASCAHCHGTDGNSSSGQYPNLASQTTEYIVLQLKSFKEGRRADPQMSPMVGILSDENMRDLADYYWAQSLARKPARVDPAVVETGKKLAEDLQCGVCHQRGYKGLKEFPRLARQKKQYVVKQLTDFRSGARTNDNGVMAPTAKNLTDEQIDALGEYFSSI